MKWCCRCTAHWACLLWPSGCGVPSPYSVSSSQFKTGVNVWMWYQHRVSYVYDPASLCLSCSCGVDSYLLELNPRTTLSAFHVWDEVHRVLRLLFTCSNAGSKAVDCFLGMFESYVSGQLKMSHRSTLSFCSAIMKPSCPITCRGSSSLSRCCCTSCSSCSCRGASLRTGPHAKPC